MYLQCPKCRHQRQPGETGDPDRCPACGIIFSKWMKQQFSRPAAADPPATRNPGRFRPGRVAGWLTAVEERVNPFYFWGRVLVFAGLVIWGWQFLRMDFTVDPFAIGRSFLHNVDLVFHEAGHVLFRPGGWFLTILGGSLGQLLMPLALGLVFLIRYRNNFGAAVCLWWLGQNCIDCAPYIDDALDQKLVLLGGHTGADAPGNHDWNNILGDLNMLEKHRDLARLVDTAGSVLILLALAWGAILLLRQYRKLDTVPGRG